MSWCDGGTFRGGKERAGAAAALRHIDAGSHKKDAGRRADELIRVSLVARSVHHGRQKKSLSAK